MINVKDIVMIRDIAGNVLVKGVSDKEVNKC